MARNPSTKPALVLALVVGIGTFQCFLPPSIAKWIRF